MNRHEMPDLVPVLSKGKHRSPRKGACFMEYASFLAGERWSDHPRCTHPLLAGVARAINDHLSDAGRSRLVPLIPTVVGLNGPDPRVDVGIATRCAAVALPVAAEPRQRALATGLLGARLIFPSLDELATSKFHAEDLIEAVDQALSHAPHATRWAERFVAGVPIDPKVFRLHSAPCMVRVAVTGISEACISDPDTLLYELLQTVIDDCTLWFGAGQVSSETAASPPPELLGAVIP
ncbi:MAG TPA: hypothetical protein VFV13_06685 [Acidimicrobiia bacterium]|nr:hypothetical protein [Acidimicrobiia bacterium]